VIYIRIRRPDQIDWQAEAGFTSWNLYRGDLQGLLTQGSYTQQPGSNPLANRQCGLTSPSGSAGSPGPGEVAFYLVTGVVGGLESDLGVTSDGLPRPNDHPCP